MNKLSHGVTCDAPSLSSLALADARPTPGSTAAEAALLEKLTDRSFVDPIVRDHDFVTLD